MISCHHLVTPSGRIHVADRGRGHPVLMIHGLLASSRMFESLLDRLPEGLRGLALDLPGFGESTPGPGYAPSWDGFARLAIETADALGLERFDLVGHSLGGGIAIVVAALWPERVRRLVLVDAVALPYGVPLKGRLPLVPVVGEALFKLYGQEVFTRYFAHDVFFDAAAMNREKVAAWYRIFAANRSMALASLRATADPGPVARSVSRVRAEAFVVWGERDGIIPPNNRARLASCPIAATRPSRSDRPKRARRSSRFSERTPRAGGSILPRPLERSWGSAPGSETPRGLRHRYRSRARARAVGPSPEDSG
jgi:2-hydroxymuconate-semialdehyde hydrolase